MPVSPGRKASALEGKSVAGGLDVSGCNRKSPGFNLAVLNQREFIRLSELIQAKSGIKISASKKQMLESRLQKRLRCLGMSSFTDYGAYLFSPEGMEKELIHMIDAVTTNKTDFFREPFHFEYLSKTIVPEFLSSGSSGILKVWSAGCSSGEEPYTLAMVLSECFRMYRGTCFSILATDICTRSLEKAKLGIYEKEKISSIPPAMRRRYLMENRDRNVGLVRITPELRSMVKFNRLNLTDDDLRLPDEKNVIFCRNVMIYFDRPTQQKLLRKLCRHLSPRGYLLLGHSETINSVDVPLVRVESTIYRKLP